MADDDHEDGPGGDDPLGDLAERVRSRRAGESTDRPPSDSVEDFDGLDEFFETESYEAVDSDELWDSLEEDSGDLMGGVEAGEGPDEHIVPKRAYCEGCEHFSEPPSVHCNHSGTSIVEYVDLDHVRVRNCPVVAKRQELGDRDEGPMTQMSFGSQGQD